jgi:gamma-glutamylcyclotransferase (GGCT)/AIG2-like uncharacterized protein YtfP
MKSSCCSNATIRLLLPAENHSRFNNRKDAGRNTAGFSLIISYLYAMTNPGVFQLFVYGSLRSGFRSPVYEYISRFFKYIGDARVKGKLYDMGTYPAGVPAGDDTYIIGELYQAKNEHEFSWAIGQLDDYEGVSVEADEVQLYRREVTEVHINETITHAWIYWYNGEVANRPVVSSGDMMEYLTRKL